jgi:membrane fusion protein (multidrug efflux system)
MWIPFAIAENQQLQLNKAVSEGRLTLPKDNAFDVQVRLADGSVLDRKGRINFSDTRINPSTGTFEMRAEVDQPRRSSEARPVRARQAPGRRAQQRDRRAAGRGDGRHARQVRVRRRQGQGRQGDRRGAPIVLGDWVTVDNQNLWVVDSGLKPASR